MSGRGLPQPRLAVTPAHLVRAGEGLDAVRLQARGFGLVLGTLGVLRVAGALDALVLRRFAGERCRVLFVGLHGIAWRSVQLAPAGRARVPQVQGLGAPAPRPALALPDLGVHLTVTPPEPP